MKRIIFKKTSIKWAIFLSIAFGALLVSTLRATTSTTGPSEKNHGSVDSLVKRDTVLMGSKFTFLIEAPGPVALLALKKITENLRATEEKISEWIPSSEVSAINANAGKMPIKVSPETFNLILRSLELSKRTEGYFDITVGPIWDLWPFRNPQKNIPTEDIIKKHLPLVGYQKIKIDYANQTIFLPLAGMALNMGATGKGYAVEIAIQILKNMGIKRAIIKAGGDMFVLGKKHAGQWKVGIEHPRFSGEMIEEFYAENLAISTSGDAHRFIIKNGIRYSHVIDPHTGKSASDCQSVTIVSRTSAEGVSTAACAMGAQKGMKWIEKQKNLQALYIDGKGKIYRSSDWRKWVKNLGGSAHE